MDEAGARLHPQCLASALCASCTLLLISVLAAMWQSKAQAQDSLAPGQSLPVGYLPWRVALVQELKNLNTKQIDQ